MDPGKKRGRKGAPPADEPQAKRSESSRMWCTVCWAWEVKSKCGKAGQAKHRCLPIADAMKESQTAFDVVHEDMKRKEQQLLQVKAAFEEEGAAVLEATLDSHESDGKYWVEGGTFRVHLAATSVSERNKEDLLEALKDNEVSFYDKEPSFTVPRDLVKDLFEKLPIRSSGVTLPPGTVLIKEDHSRNYRLTVYDRGVRPDEGEGQKLFGRVSSDTLAAFEWCWCGGSDDCIDKFCDHEVGADIELVDARFL